MAHNLVTRVISFKTDETLYKVEHYWSFELEKLPKGVRSTFETKNLPLQLFINTTPDNTDEWIGDEVASRQEQMCGAKGPETASDLTGGIVLQGAINQIASGFLHLIGFKSTADAHGAALDLGLVARYSVQTLRTQSVRLNELNTQLHEQRHQLVL